MKEELLKDIIEAEILLQKNNNVFIYIVSDSAIKKQNSYSIGGLTKTHFDEKTFVFLGTEIFVDEADSKELILRTIYHEVGHSIHYKKLGYEEYKKLSSINDSDWIKISEYEAFYYQLSEVKRISELHNDNSFLKRQIDKLEERRLNPNEHPSYKLALEELSNSHLWGECIQLTSNL